MYVSIFEIFELKKKIFISEISLSISYLDNNSYSYQRRTINHIYNKYKKRSKS